MIMNVAVPWVKHSARFGQFASSQTVTRPCRRSSFFQLHDSAAGRRFDPDPGRLAR